jgi:hypothetical protein
MINANDSSRTGTSQEPAAIRAIAMEAIELGERDRKDGLTAREDSAAVMAALGYEPDAGNDVLAWYLVGYQDDAGIPWVDAKPTVGSGSDALGVQPVLPRDK